LNAKAMARVAVSLGLACVLLGASARAEQRPRAAIAASSWVSPDAPDRPVDVVSTPGLEQRLFEVPGTAIVIPPEWVEQAALASRRQHGRSLASVHTPLAPMPASGWQRITTSRGPSSWRLAIVSDGASFLRPHFVGWPAGDGAQVVVYGGSADQPAAAVRPQPSGPGAGVWGPIVEGPILFVEVTTASGAPPSLVVDVVSNGVARARRTEAGCHLDPSCYNAWSPIKSGIARLYFEDGANGWVCSGALLTDRSHSGRPYFLTAHHCISRQAVADTSLVFWNYHTRACNGLVPTLGSVPRTAGASVLATSPITDFTLLLLAGDPPGGTAFLGWTTQPLPVGSPVTLIHHPGGDWKRVGFGAAQVAPGAGSARDRFWLAGLSRGAVEGGSSGAPLFGPSRQVIGQLVGATRMGACDDPRVSTEFGKLGASWALGLSTYLNR
jgi:hypothetical protein